MECVQIQLLGDRTSELIGQQERNREALEELSAVVEASANVTSNTDADRIVASGLAKLASHLEFQRLLIQHRLESVQLELRRVLKKSEQVRIAKHQIKEAQREEDEGTLSAEKSQAKQIHLAAIVSAVELEIAPAKQTEETHLLNSTMLEDDTQDAKQSKRTADEWRHTVQVLKALPHAGDVLVASQIHMYTNVVEAMLRLRQN